MNENDQEIIVNRLKKAYESFEAAQVLVENELWNSSINRLYYSAFYAVSALLLKLGYQPSTHRGVKILFNEHLVKVGVISKVHGKIFSQLFTWRHKGDYDDLTVFDEETVVPYFKPVKEFLSAIEVEINK